MTQAALAHAAGVQLLTLSNIERGVTENPKTQTISEIARVLGVSSDSLLYGEEQVEQSHTQGMKLPAPPAEFQAWLESDAPPDLAPHERTLLESMVFDPNLVHPGIPFYSTVLAGMRAGMSAAEMKRGIEATTQVRRRAERKKIQADTRSKPRRKH